MESAWVVLKEGDIIAHPDWHDLESAAIPEGMGEEEALMEGPIPYPKELKAHHDAYDWEPSDDKYGIQYQKYIDALIHHKAAAGEPISETTFGSDGVDTSGTRTGNKWSYVNHLWKHPNHPEHDPTWLERSKLPIGHPDHPEHFEWPSTTIPERVPTPSEYNPFEETRPQMDERLAQIAAELARRGGFMQKPSQPSAGDNPMFRHTRSEMIGMQEAIEQEIARRKAKKGGQ